MKQCKERLEYLEKAIPKGFHKKLLLLNEQVVGQIEYSPATVSYYPIIGDNVTVLNCIWVLRKAGGNDFGKRLMDDMVASEKQASSFATIALENHWSPWFKKDQMEKLGFKPLDWITVAHKTKRRQAFKIYLMWKPNTENAKTAKVEQAKTVGRHNLLHCASTLPSANVWTQGNSSKTTSACCALLHSRPNIS